MEHFEIVYTIQAYDATQLAFSTKKKKKKKKNTLVGRFDKPIISALNQCCCSSDAITSDISMMNNTFLLWVLLLVNGVFGVDADGVSVSVMVGDSVTLHTDDTEVPTGSNIIWKFGDDIIARMNEADRNPSTYDGPGALFKDRLKLDKQTGSLTITNIRTEHIGRYSVDIKSTNAKLKTFQVTVHDVVESVSLMEGDSVTLHPGVTKIQGSDQIVWKFGDQVIPITNLNSAADSRWSNIHLNDQTRDLTIRNIRGDQSGDYKVEANTISMILHRKLRINISGVFSLDGVKKISVRDGDPVPLQTRVTDITGNDVIEWTFGPQNTSIVKTDRVNGRIIYNEDDVRFTNTLHLDIKTGDLTISNTKTDNAGLYHIKII
uniref:Immunoglobulin domain-containing protein n=1 Tax=Cyprinus carpio TaxID=7962 RepID=A0A8C2EMP1_CYPCA